jgi:hypothetical protein
MMADGTICAVEGCGKPAKVRGWCRHHYGNVHRCGSPTGKGRYIGKAEKWVHAALTHQGSECLIWPFAVGKGGYGNMSVGGIYKNAHRVVCEMAHGTPAGDMEAAHSCGARLCCNPKHLRWATREQNETDKEHHGTRLRGSQIGNSKMSEETVREIKSLIRSGKKDAEIAKLFGLSYKFVWEVRARKKWAWLE